MKKLLLRLMACAGFIVIVAAYAAEYSNVIAQEPPSASPVHAPGVTAGSVIDSAYVNDFFGVKLMLPEGWNVYDAQGNEMVLDQGHRALNNDDKKAQEALDKSMGRTVVLLTVTKLPQGTVGRDNANLVCGAELLTETGIKTADQYSASNKKVLLESKLGYVLEEDVGHEKINAADFSVMSLKVERPGVTLRQKYYSILRGDYAFFCVSTHTTEENRLVVNKAINSIRFR